MPNIINKVLGQVLAMLIILGIVSVLIKLLSRSAYEKRYRNFTLKNLNDSRVPLVDKILNLYHKEQKRLSKILSKSTFLKKYSKKYQKYLIKTKSTKNDLMNFISIKFIWGGVFAFIVVLSGVFRIENLTLYRISLFFLLGFFVPDLYWKVREKSKKKQIERDMLKAIIIMNNSFKSGLSIMQAIYMVSEELDGAISEEFKKMYVDISFGLDMDLVFKRFASRVNTEEAHYITTSLSVLNKTGGNIVQVFASVERSAFTRKKLKDELSALASSAKAIYKILVALPLVMMVAIVVMQMLFGADNYFLPLVATSVGRIILVLILLIYVSYIFIINKIVNIKE